MLSRVGLADNIPVSRIPGDVPVRTNMHADRRAIVPHRNLSRAHLSAGVHTAAQALFKTSRGPRLERAVVGNLGHSQPRVPLLHRDIIYVLFFPDRQSPSDVSVGIFEIQASLSCE